MATGLLFDDDERVVSYILDTWYLQPMKYDCAVGFIKDNELIGGIIFHFFNGNNVEFSYYGQNTFTSGIVKCLSRFAIAHFNPSRVTIVINKRKKRLIRAVSSLGFKVEGTQRCYFGRRDCTRNTAVRFVLFRDALDKLAKITTTERHANVG